VISCHEVLENYISKIYKSVKKDTDKAKADMLASKLLKES
jgi:polyphosphate kinase